MATVDPGCFLVPCEAWMHPTQGNLHQLEFIYASNRNKLWLISEEESVKETLESSQKCWEGWRTRMAIRVAEARASLIRTLMTQPQYASPFSLAFNPAKSSHLVLATATGPPARAAPETECCCLCGH